MRQLTIGAAFVIATATFAGRAAAEPPVEAAQELFYNGRYADTAAATVTMCTSEVAALAACELRTSAILFQIRRAIGDAEDKDKAFAACAACPELLSTFVAETKRAREFARARLLTNPDDEQAMFVLGKLDLNYVWLQLGTLGRKTGWDEYWEARKTLDKVLKQNPANVRAKVARAWIDYIVDTKMPRGTRWLLGGGNKKKGLKSVREAAAAESDRYVRAEAGFALWDMQVREKNIPEALITARSLAIDFPNNPELQKFIDKHSGGATK